MKKLITITLLVLLVLPVGAQQQVTIAGYQYKHISGAGASTSIKATGGWLHMLTINTTVAFTMSVVDSSAADCSGGTTIAAFAASPTVGSYSYDVEFKNGLCVTTGGAFDLTFSYR